ncbi:hypothetical protein LTR85_002559 [Meristemomyces frigidus]|nr:hypothetical protein LTR85_002559 [Meristemomyces frigidus]
MGRSGHISVADDKLSISWATLPGVPSILFIQLAEVTNVRTTAWEDDRTTLRVSLNQGWVALTFPNLFGEIWGHEEATRLLYSQSFRAAYGGSPLTTIYHPIQRTTGMETLQSSPLLRLPGELRNSIYEYVSDQIDHFGFLDGQAVPCTSSNGTFDSAPHIRAHNLAHTSRQIRLEFRTFLEQHRFPAASLNFNVYNFDFRNTISMLRTVPGAPSRCINISLKLSGSGRKPISMG